MTNKRKDQGQGQSEVKLDEMSEKKERKSNETNHKVKSEELRYENADEIYE